MVKLLTLVQTCIVIYNPWSTQSALGSQRTDLNSRTKKEETTHYTGSVSPFSAIPWNWKSDCISLIPPGQHFIIYLHHERTDKAPAM